jgi:hypothetical protein
LLNSITALHLFSKECEVIICSTSRGIV